MNKMDVGTKRPDVGVELVYDDETYLREQTCKLCSVSQVVLHRVEVGNYDIWRRMEDRLPFRH